MREPATEPRVEPDREPRVAGGARRLGGRLGVNVPAGHWPSAPVVKSYEAVGFSWVQLHAPPIAVLCDAARSERHAAAARAALDTTGLRLLVHAPDDLSVGNAGHDRAFEALLAYVSLAGAELVVYHGAKFPLRPRDPIGRHDGAVLEERSLMRLAGLAEAAGVTIAVENLAPVYPGPERLCHSPTYVHDLVRRVGSPAVRTCFDVGHAHIVAGLTRTDVRRLLEPVLDAVALFHVHDNLGARRGGEAPPGLDPLRLDLHLPPGAGSVPWADIAPLLVGHRAPLMLEVHPPHRPQPLSLADVTAEILIGRGRTAAVLGGQPQH